MQKRPLGGLEMEVLRYLTDHAPASVGEVAEGFGVPHNLARTTLQTVMERLRKKGYLERTEQEGVFRYSPQVAHEDVLRGLVRDFVQKMLDGSLSPFVAYLAERQQVSEAELAELQRLVAKFRAQRQEPDTTDTPKEPGS